MTGKTRIVTGLEPDHFYRAPPLTLFSVVSVPAFCGAALTKSAEPLRNRNVCVASLKILGSRSSAGLTRNSTHSPSLRATFHGRPLVLTDGHEPKETRLIAIDL